MSHCSQVKFRMNYLFSAVVKASEFPDTTFVLVTFAQNSRNSFECKLLIFTRPTVYISI